MDLLSVMICERDILLTNSKKVYHKCEQKPDDIALLCESSGVNTFDGLPLVLIVISQKSGAWLVVDRSNSKSNTAAVALWR